MQTGETAVKGLLIVVLLASAGALVNQAQRTLPSPGTDSHSEVHEELETFCRNQAIEPVSGSGAPIPDAGRKPASCWTTPCWII